MGDATFRVAKPTQESKPVQAKPATDVKAVSVDEATTDLPPTQYQDVEGKPYLSQYLGLENVFHDLDSDFKLDMEDVDSYFNIEVKRKKYENNKDGYKSYLKKLVKLTDTKDKPKRAKYGKIAEFIRYVRRTERFGQ